MNMERRCVDALVVEPCSCRVIWAPLDTPGAWGRGNAADVIRHTPARRSMT